MLLFIIQSSACNLNQENKTISSSYPTNLCYAYDSHFDIGVSSLSQMFKTLNNLSNIE
jgi:hypothetical protein